MKKIFLHLAAIMLWSATASAQTTVLNEDFDGDVSNWYTNYLGSQTNEWWIGTSTVYSGSRSAYISYNNGSTCDYDYTSESTVHLWKNVNLPSSTSSNYLLTFYWKCNGESIYDYMEVFLVDTTVTPTAGTELRNNYTPLGTYNGSTTWQQAAILLPASATTKRLVFSWHNDNSVYGYPPAAIDNIVITDFSSMSSTIHLTDAGTLQNQANTTFITNLTLTGNIDARDIRYMRDNMPLLSELNISGATIVEYNGSYGTVYGSSYSYPVNEMPEYSFFNLNTYQSKTSLTSIRLPTNITSIRGYAFANCSGLTSVTIPNWVTSIGGYAFSDCSGLTSVTIPNSVISIGGNAFSYCSALASVTLGNSVASIGEYAFFSCRALASVNLGNSVASIGEYAFSYCDALTSVTIPNSVTTIGWKSFSDCDALTSVTIGNSVTTIEGYAFAYNSKLTTASFNATNCISIGSFDGSTIYPVFSDCPLFTNLTIGNDVQTIPDFAFCYTPSLTSVIISNSVTTIGKEAFYNCRGLTTLTIGNSVSVIGNWAFGCDSNLTSIIIPNSVTSIGYSAFNRCNKLTSVTIGSSVTSMGDYVFYDCSSLREIYVKAQNPPTLGSSVFYNVTNNIPVHVPCNRANTYRNDYGWAYFNNFVEDISFEITLLSNNPTMGVANIVQANTCTDNTAIIDAVPKTGYRFVDWNDGITITPRTIIVTQNITYTARFETLKYKVEVLPNDFNMGMVTGGGEYEINATVSIRAIPLTGYQFVRWSDGDIQNPRTVTVTQNITYIAIFDVGTAITDVETSSISIYPNPATDNIHITLPENVQQGFFTLYDMQGKILIRKEINNQDAISVSNLAAGIYIYNVTTDKQKHTGKLIKVSNK
jgi:hypothetical protein